MGTAVKPFILYLIPVLSCAALVGFYMLAYGQNLNSPIIDFALLLIVPSFITTLGWLLGLISIVIYLVIFKDVLSP